MIAGVTIGARPGTAAAEDAEPPCLCCGAGAAAVAVATIGAAMIAVGTFTAVSAWGASSST